MMLGRAEDAQPLEGKEKPAFQPVISGAERGNRTGAQNLRLAVGRRIFAGLFFVRKQRPYFQYAQSAAIRLCTALAYLSWLAW